MPPRASAGGRSRARRPRPRRAGARPGRSRSPRSSRPQATSPITSAVVDAGRERRRARADREVGVPELRGDRATREPGVAEPLGDELGEPPHLGVQAARGPRCRARTCPRPRRRPAPPRARGRAGRSRARGRGGAARPIPAGRSRAPRPRAPPAPPIVVDAGPPQPLLGARADPGQQPHGERREEAGLAAGRHDRDAARLPPVGRDLAHDLRRADAERAREARLRADGRLHRRGDRARAVKSWADGPEVEVALVEPRPLEPGHDLGDRVPDRARVLAVERVARAQEDGVRAAPERLRRRHRGVDPERCAPRSSRSTTTPRPCGSPPTTSGRSRRLGSSSSSTAAKKASRSRWARIGVAGVISVRHKARRRRSHWLCSAALSLRRGGRCGAAAAGDRAARAVPGVVRARHRARRPGHEGRRRVRERPRARREAAPRSAVLAPRRRSRPATSRCASRRSRARATLVPRRPPRLRPPGRRAAARPSAHATTRRSLAGCDRLADASTGARPASTSRA